MEPYESKELMEKLKNKPLRKNILKLAQMHTDRMTKKITKTDPEYYMLDCLMTDDMCTVALQMKTRIGYTAAELAPKCKMPEEQVQQLLDEMADIGYIDYNWENEDHHKQYCYPIYVPGNAEYLNMNPKIFESVPEVTASFEGLSRLPLEALSPMIPVGGAGVGMRVIPVEKAIPAAPKSESIEHLSFWLEKYKDSLSLGPCSCRIGRRIHNDGDGSLEDDVCIGVGDMAKYMIETGKAHATTYDEVIQVLKRCEDLGYVHQVTNIDGENKIFAICNCERGVCYAMRNAFLYNTPNMSRSNYVAEVDQKNCVACGQCVQYCPANAVKLGQKVCTVRPITYPKHELPDAKKWGKEHWNPDYRNSKTNCYDTGTSPCKTACPAHIAVQGYIKKAAQGRYMEALRLIKKENPFPAVCGKICNHRCEDECSRARLDESVAIDDIKLYIAEKELNAKTRYIPPIITQTGKLFTEKIAVIGAGPAGMSCAYYLRERGYPVTVFEKDAMPGGMLRYGVPSFVLEKNLLDAEIDVLKQMGVEFRFNTNVGQDITLSQLREQGYKAFYVAIGCQGGRLSGVPGEDAKGVETGVALLHEIAEDETRKVNGKAVVIGGGNVAIDVARTAVRAGAESTAMYCLETEDIMPALPEEIANAKAEGIGMNCGWGPKEILSENGSVTGIVFKKCTQVYDSDHHFAPVYDENETINVPCDHVYLAIGQSIVWGDLLKDTRVEFGRGNGPVADQITYQTGEPDIFVGGDVYTGPKFAIDAIAAGKEACESIHRFVHAGQSLTICRDHRDFISLDRNNLAPEAGSYDLVGRQVPYRAPSADAKLTFHDLNQPLTDEQVKKETGRCLGCGASIVDQNVCIGCGVCVTKCDFDAIHLKKAFDKGLYKTEDRIKLVLGNAAKRSVRILKKEDVQVHPMEGYEPSEEWAGPEPLDPGTQKTGA